MDVVLKPDGPVGEADLAPDRPLAALFALAAHGGGGVVRVFQTETGMARGERRNLAAGAKDSEGLRCGSLDSRRPKSTVFELIDVHRIPSAAQASLINSPIRPGYPIQLGFRQLRPRGLSRGGLDG